MEKLNRFTKDQEMLNEVKTYLVTYLQSMALEGVFNSGKTEGLKEAGLIIKNGFDKMEAEFADKVEKKQINEAQ